MSKSQTKQARAARRKRRAARNAAALDIARALAAGNTPPAKLKTLLAAFVRLTAKKVTK